MARTTWLKATHAGRRTRSYRSAFGIDDHIERLDTDLAQHGTEQSRFVFAVTVVMGKHVGGGMGLKASNSQFNGDVANVMLHKVRERLHLVERGLG